MIELKPCPHCGKKVQYAYDVDMEPYGIHCLNCHMVAKFYRVEPPSMREPYERVMSDIAVRWNERSGE